MDRDLGERLDGERILEESPGDLGLLLWRTARDVALWAMTPEETRAGLFAAGTTDARVRLVTATELPDALSGPVDTLHAMLGEPDRADAEIVMLCCGEVAAWSRGAGLPHTAVAFAQAGASAAPLSGDAAVFVGVCAWEAGQSVRADTWLRRAVAVSRRERNGAAYSAALVELGALNDRQDKLLRAERFYRLAMRASRRTRARDARMRAAHALFRLARRKGDDVSAAQFALSAQKACEDDAAGAGGLLLDLARFWTDVSEIERARGALRRLVPALLTMDPAGQLCAFALTARAQSVPGRRNSGSVAWRAAWVLLGNKELPDAVRCAAALDLAHAARTVGDLRAFRAARRAVLVLAPQAEYPAVAERMAELWPDIERPQMDRAS
ncbi:hypothetical protein [Longimicrobium sp.]|uniref:hypothetical protein n=1 Tax=Longimicrobium sp. TaxID=2029185 RepID=UPI003B3B81F7